MASSNVSNSQGAITPRWDEALVFPALLSQERRKLLFALVDGPKVGFDLQVGKGTALPKKARRSNSFLSSTTKNLKVLTDAGLVVPLENPQDRRQRLYSLTPETQVTMVDDLAVFDFGFLVARLSEDGN